MEITASPPHARNPEITANLTITRAFPPWSSPKTGSSGIAVGKSKEYWLYCGERDVLNAKLEICRVSRARYLIPRFDVLWYFFHAPIFMPSFARLFLDSRDRAQLVCDKTFSVTRTSTNTVSLSTSRIDMFHPLNVMNN